MGSEQLVGIESFALAVNNILYVACSTACKTLYVDEVVVQLLVVVVAVVLAIISGGSHNSSRRHHRRGAKPETYQIHLGNVQNM